MTNEIRWRDNLNLLDAFKKAFENGQYEKCHRMQLQIKSRFNAGGLSEQQIRSWFTRPDGVFDDSVLHCVFTGPAKTNQPKP